MKNRALIWTLIVLSLITCLSACFFPVGGGDDHHDRGDYHEGHD